MFDATLDYLERIQLPEAITLTIDLGHALSRISESADYTMWKQGIPGLVLGITDRKETLLTSAKGLSEVTGRRPMTPDSLFQIGSVSKSFTSIAILQLADQEVLDIHAPVRKYLPWFSIRSKYSDITLHHLMTHTAGIIQGSDATPTNGTEVWDLRDSEAGFEPGTYFHYSNSGYKTLGLVLETVTGKGYDRIIREGIFEPAGMKSAEAIMTNEIRGRLAMAHEPMLDDRPFRRGSQLYPATWFESDTADGSICASIEDMMAYIRVILNRGKGPYGPILSERLFDLMTTEYSQPDDGLHPGGYGYGLNIERADGHTYIGHQGGMVGYHTSMLVDVDLGMGVMVMINGPGEPEEAARFAMNTLKAASTSAPLPDVPSKNDVYRISNAQDYVGTFSGQQGRLEIVDRDGELHVITEGFDSPIEKRGKNSFIVYGPGFDLFLLDFELRDGVAERIHYGSHTYTRGASKNADPVIPRSSPVRYEGHYRSHNPWLTNFRVVRRASGLVFIMPDGESQPLVPIGENRFRIGADERSPERIAFEGIVDGVAIAAVVSGGGRYGRTFTP